MGAVDNLNLPSFRDQNWHIQLGEQLRMMAAEIDAKRDNTLGIQDVVANSAIELDLNYDVFRITGSGTIYSINPVGRLGRTVTLHFPGAVPLIVSDNEGNIDLDSLFTSEPGASLTLFCDGSEFHEVSRSNPSGGGGGDPVPASLIPDPDNPGFYFFAPNQTEFIPDSTEPGAYFINNQEPTA